MSEQDDALIGRVKTVSGIEINKLLLLAENSYCSIFRGEATDGPLIIKKYKTDDDKLPRLEAKGVDMYHRLAASDNGLIDSRALFTDHEMNLVGISFVPGKSLAGFIYEHAGQAGDWPAICSFAERLGVFLRRARALSRKENAEFTPFHREYLLYCSKKLRALPFVGRPLFRDIETSAVELADALERSSECPSFAHGDFVFRNIHVDGDRLGLIDFANCLEDSHPLNDAFNLWFALQNMIIAQSLKKQVWQAFLNGLGSERFAEPAINFFYEYHRRRWLMLNLGSRDPRRWARAILGIRKFAPDFRSARQIFNL